MPQTAQAAPVTNEKERRNPDWSINRQPRCTAGAARTLCRRNRRCPLLNRETDFASMSYRERLALKHSDPDTYRRLREK